MNSMTGFGRCEVAKDGLSVVLQVSSVNRKNLEIVCSLPKDLQSLERLVVERARGLVGRGRLQFSFEVKRDVDGPGGLPSDLAIDAAIERLKAISMRHGSDFKLDQELLVSIAQLVEDAGAPPLDEAIDSMVLDAVDAAMKDLLRMREQEGVALKADLEARRQILATAIAAVKELAPEMVAKHRENLFARLEQAGLQLDLNDERVLKEVCLYADRCDVSEEITRLESHMVQFGQLLEKEGPVGRPLEFLLQEVGREINTTGSKATSIEVSKWVLEMKNELERIREQVANVE